ncbi:4-hydroxy-tetrahydrodipicolinate synthase [Umezawaea sp. NPDC059074]|uniref:4-hydroxy-tetrahydrodipicolinate synthase n=1 Tax=Umezawaea sp. NPDC059074 TaxID=3346716 RepID=UPI0036B63DD2
MATPMTPTGEIDQDSLTSLITHLLTTNADGLVVAGTTGESPTLTPEETTHLIHTVKSQTSTQAKVIAGIGTYNTAESTTRAQAAKEAGADALLLVTPYYSRPTQQGVIAHCTAVADATDLPVMLYDVPARTGTPLDESTLITLATHPRIQAVKDAKGDLFQAMSVMSRTTLAYYSGIDELNLAYLACGATGVVSVTGNIAAAHNADLIQAIRSNNLTKARAIHRDLIPITNAIMRTSQGAIMAKAALAHQGIIRHASVRLPLLESPPDHLDLLTAALSTLPAR